uniref:Uncharacterized protein n=1 Tax=Octopus bimaculoides TaxID=37653 RepID=A0A0L8G7K0_OCTBM
MSSGFVFRMQIFMTFLCPLALWSSTRKIHFQGVVMNKSLFQKTTPRLVSSLYD